MNFKEILFYTIILLQIKPFLFPPNVKISKISKNASKCAVQNIKKWAKIFVLGLFCNSDIVILNMDGYGTVICRILCYIFSQFSLNMFGYV